MTDKQSAYSRPDDQQDIFAQVGKKTPFRAPENYFDHAADDIKHAVRRASARRTLYWISGAAAVLLLLVAIYPICRLVNRDNLPQEQFAPVYCETADYDDEDWTDFANADIFLENLY